MERNISKFFLLNQTFRTQFELEILYSYLKWKKIQKNILQKFQTILMTNSNIFSSKGAHTSVRLRNNIKTIDESKLLMLCFIRTK